MTTAERRAGGAALEEVAVRLGTGHRNVGAMVYDVIKEAIVRGACSALMQLASEGLVAFHPRRGAVVRSLSPREIVEVCELRQLLERHALGQGHRLDVQRSSRRAGPAGRSGRP